MDCWEPPGQPVQGCTGESKPDVNGEAFNLNANQSLSVGLGEPQFPLPKPKAADTWRLMRPYGIWTCADGRQVIFNRDYIPILERYPGQACRAANPSEWVDWVEQRWFYNDGTPVEQVKRVMNAALRGWGLPPMPPKP